MQTATATKTARTFNPPANGAKPAAAVSGMSPIGDKPAAPAAPEELFNIAVAAINKRFKMGTLERLAIERPDLAAEIARAMDRVEITWRESGPVGSPAFKLALRTWYDLVILAIDYFEDGKK